MARIATLGGTVLGFVRHLLGGPALFHVICRECGATICYLPEEVKEWEGMWLGRVPYGWRRVKCPRQGCPGHGYVEEWPS